MTTMFGQKRNLPFLKNLEPHDQLNTTSGVKLARVPTEQHGQIARLVRRLALELNNVADVLEFGFGETVSFATKAAKDVPALFLTPDLYQPTG